MNGRELQKASLGDGPALDEHQRSRADEERLEKWAELVSGCLQNAVPVPPAPLGLGGDENLANVPEGWRPSVGAMTPDQGAFAGGSESSVIQAASEGRGEGAPERIQIRVNTREFGEVALVIERAEQGLRILLGAVDGRIVAALRQEALSVRRALESGGQRVGALEIVRMDEVGTVLAQNKLAPGNRVRRLRQQADNSSAQDQKRKLRRINLVG